MTLPTASPVEAIERSAGEMAGRPLPRVLYAIALDGSQKFGSLEEQIFFLATAFQAEGSLLLPLFVAAECPNRAGLEVFDKAGLPTAEMNLWRFSWKKLNRLRGMIRAHGIQVVHWNFYAPVNPYFLGLLALEPGVRHYLTDHNSRTVPLPQPRRSLAKAVKRRILRRYSQVWCVSRFVNDCLARQGTWSNLETCLHFINTDRFRPDAAVRDAVRRQHGHESSFVLLAVANLIPEKGLDVAIRALAETPADVVLWIVGQGPQAGSLQALATSLRLDKRVRLFGQQTHVQPFMQAADCLVCPSTWAEAAGLVNLEALATALPVLASRVGGIPEYVDHGQTGLLFPPGDHRALAELICQLQADRDECRRLGDNARETAMRRFSVPANLHAYLDQYRKFADSR
jgi:glycosyltransferase involved in cell wall biosynthesis